MKKLMIAAAALLCGVMAQASTVSWTINSVKDAKGNTLGTGYVYVFFQVVTGSTKADSSAFNSVKSAADLETKLADATYTYSKTNAGGTFGVGRATPDTYGLEYSTKYSCFAVITDTEDITATTKYYVTASSLAGTTLTEASQQNKQYTMSAASSSTSTNWKAVPEPTSGLLLLLGMAGLALRRRRA